MNPPIFDRVQARLRSSWPFGLIALGIVQLVWLGWILNIPFPNVEANKKVPTPGQVMASPVTRAFLAVRAIPQVVPGVTFRESYLGLAMGELSAVSNLSQRGPIVAAASLILLAALSLGMNMIRALGLGSALNLHERIPLGFGVGIAGLGVLTLITGRLGLIGPWPVRIGLGVITISGTREWWLLWQERGDFFPASPFDKKGYVAAVLLGIPFVVLMALAAMLPTSDFDGLEYHLQGPKEYYQAGQIRFLAHNVYTAMPFSIEMLHLLGMEILDDWWYGALVGQLLIMVHAVFATGCIALAAGKWGSPRAAWVSAVGYLSTPWIYRLAAMPYVEGPLCYVHAAIVYAAGWAWTCRDELKARAWTLVGLLAGGAMAIKYPSLVSAVIPFGCVAFLDSIRAKNWKIVPCFGLGVALIMASWLGKNLVDTGNPVYPLGYSVFGGSNWSPELDKKWAAAHGSAMAGYKSFALGELWSSIVDVAGKSDWQSPLYAILAPLALLRAGSRRVAFALWGFVVYLFLTWWLFTHRLDRFWIPLLAPLAVLAGLGADWIRNRAWSVWLGIILAICLFTNLVYNTTALAALNEWTADLPRLRVSLRERVDSPLLRLDDTNAPGEVTLVVGQAAVFPMEHSVQYSVVFSPEIFEQLTRDRSAEQIRQSLRDRKITRVYVDWSTIDRFKSPGNYGWTEYTTPERFRGLVEAGVLSSPIALGLKHEVYQVK